MKIAIVIARVLLGLVFTVFGLNGLHPFLPQPPMSGDAGAYFMLLFTHHFTTVIFTVQLVGGILLLIGRYVPLALTLLGPVIVNILMFHALLSPSGVAPAILVTVLELFLIWAYRLSFRGLFDAAPEMA